MRYTANITMFVAQILFFCFSLLAQSTSSTPSGSVTKNAPGDSTTIPKDSVYEGISDSTSESQDLSSMDSVTTDAASQGTNDTLSNTPESSVNTTIDSTDTLQRIHLRDSLLNRQRAGKSHFLHPSLRDSSSQFPSALKQTIMDIFSSDATASSELLQSTPFFVRVPYTLSSSLNRYLLFGNVAPISRVSYGGPLSHRAFDFYMGTDNIFTTQINAISLEPFSNISYQVYPTDLVSPEVVIFWENGVFNENILDVRFSRPLARRLMLSVYSNYRNFEGKNYVNSTDIQSFYFSLLEDTSKLSNIGHNPYTNEHIIGARLHWFDTDSAIWYSDIQYGSFINDIVVDSPAANLIQLHWHRLDQYRTGIELGMLQKNIGPLLFDIQSRYQENIFINRPTRSTRNDGSERSLAFAMDSRKIVGNKDTAGILFGVEARDVALYNKEKSTFLHSIPEAYYSNTFNFGAFEGTLKGIAGYYLNTTADTTEYAPIVSFSATGTYKNQHVRFFVEQNALPFNPPPTYPFSIDSHQLLDRYIQTGGDIQLGNGVAGLILGYHYLFGVARESILNSWPSGTPPYPQPQSTISINPYFSRWHGLSFSSNVLLSDTKPYIKSHSKISFIAHPLHTSEFIELTLGLDYWSKRDPIVFAGMNDWNREIIDVYLNVTAHIRSFRLFYKVDNLLNRRYAYVPGYKMPGLTFRWGFNWFIQR